MIDYNAFDLELTFFLFPRTFFLHSNNKYFLNTIIIIMEWYIRCFVSCGFGTEKVWQIFLQADSIYHSLLSVSKIVDSRKKLWCILCLFKQGTISNLIIFFFCCIELDLLRSLRGNLNYHLFYIFYCLPFFTPNVFLSTLTSLMDDKNILVCFSRRLIMTLKDK